MARLFQPLPIGRGGRELPNRIWLPAMVTWRSTDDGVVTDAVRDIYVRYAQGGAGMIVLEAMGIRDIASGPLLRLSDDRYVPGLKHLVDELRRAAAFPSLFVPQIIDFLKISTRKPTRAFFEGAVKRGQLEAGVLALSDDELLAQAPSLLSPRLLHDLRFGYRQTIADLDRSEIACIPDWFAQAARRAQQAGFDGVELHFAHAYTMASFLSVTNQRTDEYGGSLTNRLRLPREVIEAVRGAVGREFVVGCRYLGAEDIALADGTVGGNTVEDAAAIGVALCDAGLDFLSVSRGGKFDDAKQPAVGESAYPYTGPSGHACIPRRKSDLPGVNAHLAATIRAAVRAAGHDVPVVTAGKIFRFAQAEQLLSDGKADLIGMARALLADPDLPRKWLGGQDAAVTECVFCPYCEQEDQHHRTVTCTLWPRLPGTKLHAIPPVWRP